MIRTTAVLNTASYIRDSYLGKADGYIYFSKEKWNPFFGSLFWKIYKANITDEFPHQNYRCGCFCPQIFFIWRPPPQKKCTLAIDTMHFIVQGGFCFTQKWGLGFYTWDELNIVLFIHYRRSCFSVYFCELSLSLLYKKQIPLSHLIWPCGTRRENVG